VCVSMSGCVCVKYFRNISVVSFLYEIIKKNFEQSTII
jgi:hypothetical protein